MTKYKHDNRMMKVPDKTNANIFTFFEVSNTIRNQEVNYEYVSLYWNLYFKKVCIGK